RETALVRELRERVRLVDDLRELTAAEEVVDRRADRLRVDDRARREVLLLEERHALLDRPLQLEETLAELVARELVDRAHAAVAEVVDVVELGTAVRVAQLEDELDRRDEVVLAERLLVLADDEAELAVDAEAADAPEAILVRVEELFLEELLRLLELRRVTR